MSQSNLHALSQPEVTTNDPLHDLIRKVDPIFRTMV